MHDLENQKHLFNRYEESIHNSEHRKTPIGPYSIDVRTKYIILEIPRSIYPCIAHFLGSPLLVFEF